MICEEVRCNQASLDPPFQLQLLGYVRVSPNIDLHVQSESLASWSYLGVRNRHQHNAQLHARRA